MRAQLLEDAVEPGLLPLGQLIAEAAPEVDGGLGRAIGQRIAGRDVEVRQVTAQHPGQALEQDRVRSLDVPPFQPQDHRVIDLRGPGERTLG